CLLRKIPCLLRRLDMRAVHLDLIHRIPNLKCNLLGCGVNLRCRHLLCADCPIMVGSFRLVGKRNLKIEAERIGGVAETEELTEGVAYSTGHDPDDCISAQRGLQSLNSAQAVLP